MAKFTDSQVRSFPAPGTGQKLYTDDTLPGFGVRVSQGGSKTFVLMVGKERRRITLGRYQPSIFGLADARVKAIRILRDIELGIEHKPSPAFGEVHREYMAGRSDLRANTHRADKQNFRPFLVLARRKIGDITSDDLKRIIEGIEAPVRRLHSFHAVGHLLRFAIKRGYIDRNPIDRLYAPKKRPPRERVLSPDELKAVWRTAIAYGYPYGTIIQLLILTAQRRTQVAELRREWVDYDAKVFRFPASVMKNKKPHVVPLTPMAETILHNLTPNEQGLYFYGSTGNTFVGFGNYAGDFINDAGVDHFTRHDLRRTWSTIAADSLDIQDRVIDAVLSHARGTRTQRTYNQAKYIQAMRHALLMYETWLQALLSRTEGTNAEQHPSGDRGIHHKAA